jgi:hypothetical protein
MRATSHATSVWTHPDTPFSTAVAISVVASPITGTPTAMASSTARPRLV